MQPPATAPPPGIARRRWTREEYARLAELGWFDGQRVELIDGEIMVLSPQKFAHNAAVNRARERLEALFGPSYWVRPQAPMGFGAFSEPEPDVSVVAGRREDHTEHPSTAVLVVEVSDSTLRFDRGHKASLYACVGIQEYWIVNLVDGQLEVHRQPVPDPQQDLGHGYADREVLRPPATIAPLALPGAAVAVAELLAG